MCILKSNTPAQLPKVDQCLEEAETFQIEFQRMKKWCTPIPGPVKYTLKKFKNICHVDCVELMNIGTLYTFGRKTEFQLSRGEGSVYIFMPPEVTAQVFMLLLECPSTRCKVNRTKGNLILRLRASKFLKFHELMMAIQETLHHYPPAAFVIREYLQDMKLGDFIIPKGVTVRILMASLHRDPEIWGSDAGEFNPGRFENGVSEACKIPHTYLPFGVGARICPGQNFSLVELKIILSQILSRFSFSLSPRVCDFGS